MCFIVSVISFHVYFFGKNEKLTNSKFEFYFLKHTHTHTKNDKNKNAWLRVAALSHVILLLSLTGFIFEL